MAAAARNGPGTRRDGQPAGSLERRYVVSVGGRELVVGLREVSDGLRVTVDGEAVDLRLETGALPVVAGALGGRRWRALAQRDGDEVVVVLGGETWRARVRDPHAQVLERVAAATPALTPEQVIRAPMPGLVVGVPVAVGDVVEAGQCVAVLQAMKMENELRATAPGTVVEVRAEVGQTVDQRQVLVVVR